MKTLDELLERAQSVSKFGGNHQELGALLQSERGFPNGFWHAHDADGAFDVIVGCLEGLGLNASMLPEAVIRAVVERHAGSLGNDRDEDLARREQIAEVVAYLNASLEERGGAYRFWSCAEDLAGWESDEPVWMLLTEDERTLLLERDFARPSA